MIKNISEKIVTLRWNGLSVELKPKESYDIRDFNVPQNEVVFVEAKLGGKNEGLVEITHTKSELLSRREIRDQQAGLDKQAADLAKDKAEFAKEKKATK